jgi:hypothetical protein
MTWVPQSGCQMRGWRRVAARVLRLLAMKGLVESSRGLSRPHPCSGRAGARGARKPTSLGDPCETAGKVTINGAGRARKLTALVGPCETAG